MSPILSLLAKFIDEKKVTLYALNTTIKLVTKARNIYARFAALTANDFDDKITGLFDNLLKELTRFRDALFLG